MRSPDIWRVAGTKSQTNISSSCPSVGSSTLTMWTPGDRTTLPNRKKKWTR